VGRAAPGLRFTLPGTAGLLLSLLLPTRQRRRAGGTQEKLGLRRYLAQPSPRAGSGLILRRGRAARPAAVSQPRAEGRASSGSGVFPSAAFPAPWPAPQHHQPRGAVSRERFWRGRGSSSCCAGGWAAWRGGGEALCVVLTCSRALLLRSGPGLSDAVALGSGRCCARAWRALDSKRLSRVFVTQLPAGDRYVPGPDSGGHVPWAPWPFNHVRRLHPGWELARWHWLRLQPSLLPGFLLTALHAAGAAGLPRGERPLPGCRAGVGCALSPSQSPEAVGPSVIPVPHGALAEPGTCRGSCACATNFQRPPELPGPALNL